MKDDINGRRHQEDNLIFEKSLMEKNLNGRQPQWKMNSMEYDLNVRRSQWKTTSMEDDMNGRRHQEDDLNGRKA